MFEKLRKIKPIIKDVNEVGGRLDPRFHGVKFDVPAKVVANTRDMELLRLYTHGPLKWENTGKTCGNCVNFYLDPHVVSQIHPDPNPSGKGRGRCKAKGYCQVHEDYPAETTYDWTDKDSGVWFKEWPECPYFVQKDRLSRR